MPNDKQHRDGLNRAVNYWLRSAASAEQCRYVYYYGNVGSYNATNSNSARPAFKVSKDTMVSDATEDTIYILPDASKLYRELSFVAYCGETTTRPKKAKVQLDITNATEYTVQISNNAKDETPVWVDCAADQVVELSNTTKTTDNWVLGVKVYAKSEGRAVCGQPVAIVELEEEEAS